MLSEVVNFEMGKIIIDNFECDIIDDFHLKKELLSEDMLQASYPLNIILDVSWHYGLEMFIIFITKDSDWENIIEKRLCVDINDLIDNLNHCIKNIKELLLKEEYFIDD